MSALPAGDLRGQCLACGSLVFVAHNQLVQQVVHLTLRLQLAYIPTPLIIDPVARGNYRSLDKEGNLLARIEQVNDKVHCVTEINPDALEIAAELDRERAAGNIRGQVACPRGNGICCLQ